MKKLRLVCITLCLILSCILCCSCRIVSLEEVIPSEDEMGQSEGLWLYKSEFRSRTDGSEKENMLSDVEFGGKRYSSDEIVVKRCEYFKEQYKIFFYLTVAGNQDYYCFYDYKSKTSKVYQSEADEYKHLRIFEKSDSTIYLRYGDQKGFLYNANGDLLAEGVYDRLIHDTLHGLTYRDGAQRYQWWDGSYHMVKAPIVYSVEKYVFTNEYIYLFCTNKIIAVNRQSEEVILFHELEGEKFTFVHADDKKSVYAYGTTTVKKVENAPNVRAYNFFKIDGVTVTPIYTFDRAAGIFSNVVEEKIYFIISNSNNNYSRYFYYDINQNKIERISDSKYVSPTYGTPFPQKTVNDYKFFVTYKYYNPHHALLEREACYYLNRTGPNGLFIMQYSLESECFFDDICDF